MSHPAVSYVCRSCRHALRSKVLVSSQQQTSRSFSNTPANTKALATFTPTSSPELDALLSTWRNEVFLPSILSPHHQRLIYKKSRHEILTTPPGVTVTVETELPPLSEKKSHAEEEFKLAPMNAFDRPNKKKSLQQLCKHLLTVHTAPEWDNIIPFLEGMRVARYCVPDQFLETLIRRASSHGQLSTIIRAAALVERTGLSLSKRGITRELLFRIRDNRDSFYHKGDRFRQTLETIILMLEEEGHCAGLSQKDIGQGRRDMRKDPLLLAVILEEAAYTATFRHKGKDPQGEATRAAAKFLALARSLPGGVIGFLEGENLGRSPAFVLEELVVVSHALKLAEKVDLAESTGNDANYPSKKELRELSEKVSARIDVLKSQVEAEANGKPRRWSKMSAWASAREQTLWWHSLGLREASPPESDKTSSA